MNVKEGDEVRVFLWRRSDPEGGNRATVTKIGRKYATATWGEARLWLGREEAVQRSIDFDMETGNERNGRTHGTGGSYVRTLEQVALDERRRAAAKALFTAGISISDPSRFTLEQVEVLAEVAKTLPALDRERL